MKLLEKIVFRRVKKDTNEVIDVTVGNIGEFLGLPFQTPKDHTKTKVGVAIGLGDSDYGGRLTYIEASKRSFSKQTSFNRGLLLTGSLQKVFKESIDIGYTFARNFLK